MKERDRNGKFYILNDGNAQMLKANKATGEKVAGKYHPNLNSLILLMLHHGSRRNVSTSQTEK